MQDHQGAAGINRSQAKLGKVYPSEKMVGLYKVSGVSILEM